MGMDRREFLLAGLAAALETFSPRVGLLAEAAGSGVRAPYARLTELAPGAILPGGWVKLYLAKQAGALAYALPDVSWPFSAEYWAGEEKAGSWWPWEQTAYWVDGAVRCALASWDQKLMERAMGRVRYTLAHPDGTFLGAKAIEDPTEGYHRWPHALFFRGLEALSDAGVVRGMPETLTSFYVNDTADYALLARNVVNVESMLWAYNRGGDGRLLELAERSWEGYVAGKPHDPADLSREKTYGGGPITSHGVTYAEIAKLPAILHMYTGNPEYMRFALAAQQRVFDHHMLVDGIPSTTEYFRGTTALDSHETCDISDHTWSWGYLLMATGDGVWADRIERGCLNAGMGAIRKDWKGVQYFSCPNQVLATLTSNHNVLKPGNYWMAYQPNPGRGTACCGANVHRMLPNYALRMWMGTPDGGVAAVLYGASSVKAKVGRDGDEVTLVQETGYPFEEEVRFTVKARRAVEFPLKLRVPGWCAGARVRVNGKDVPLPMVEAGFVTLARRFHPGDVVVLSLPMTVKSTRWPDGGIAFERGPLVYAHSIAAKWSSSVEEKWSTAAYPLLSAEPVGVWNYGVPGDGVAKAVTVPGGDAGDPWQAPGVGLEVGARRVGGWEAAVTELPLDPKAAVGAVKTKVVLTPPLPVERAELGAVETIRLVPYGSTELRVTVFPVVEG
jgi:hypothetical protein